MRLVSHKQARRRLATGDRIDDHLIIRSVLGKGGTATVFEALHERLGSLVALKVMDVAPEYAQDAAARLEREAQVCAAIDDSHIPKIYDVGELPDGTPYIVMEKVPGRTLDDMLEEGPLPAPEALQIVRELMDALSAVHRVGVVHRDVKPANVIAQAGDDGMYRVRLMDFGVSKGISAGRVSNPAITHEGALVGTPHYMAPEQMSDDGVDERTDVYAAGVLLYELLTGRVPFDGKSTTEVMTAVMRHTYAPLSALRPDASAQLTRLVARAMSARPSDRFASAREMRDAIDAEISAIEGKTRKRASPYPMAVASFSSIALAGVLALASRQAAQPGASNPKRSQSGSAAQHKASKGTEASVTRSPSYAPPPFMTPVVEVAPTTIAAKPANASPEAHARRRSRGERPTDNIVATQAAAPPLAHGVLISDYVEQLEELERAVSGVAASLEGPGPLPDNPYP